MSAIGVMTILTLLPILVRACIDSGKSVACCVDPVPANNCSACLTTTDQRQAWASKCVWLSAASTTSPQRCQPSKWWDSSDSKPDKQAGIHSCETCGACAPPPPPVAPPPAPPPCTPETNPRAACWPGTWTSAPTTTPKTPGKSGLGIVDGPILGNGVMSSVQTIGKCGGTNALCHFIDRTDAWTPATGAISNCGYSAAGALTVGHLSIATSPAPALGNVFMASQNAANATVTVAVPLAGGGMLHTETIIARAENVLIVTLWTSGTNTEIGVNASIPKLPNGGCYWSDQDVVNNSVVTWRQIGAAYQDQIHSTVGLRRSVKYAISVASPDGAVCRDADGSALICVPKVSSKHRATVVVTVVHNYDLGFEDPIRPAANLTNALTMRGGGGEAALAELRADHSRWWADFWRRTSYVYMPGSPAAEKLWYGSLYILASGNRDEPTRLAAGRYAGDGRLPPPMGLVWPKTSDTPAFSGSYTMNYVRSHLLTKKLPVEHANVPSQKFRHLLPYHASSCLRHAMQNQQGIYFGVHAANASWLGLANEQAMLEYIPRGHMDARAQFNCSGINMDCEIFAWGQTTTTVGDQGQRSNAALTAVQFANHWLYTRDVKWLKTHYTFPREVIAFFTDYLTLEADGKYHSLNDCLNELCSGDLGDHVESLIRNDDPHVTIGLLRFLFPVVVEMAQTLGVDADQIPKWRHIGTNLAPYVDVAQPGNNTNGARIYGRFRGALHAPRQNTQLTFSASWPGYDPELNSNATLRQLDNATAIYMQSFTCGNCFPLFPPGAVRSGVAVDATWHSSLAAIDCGWQENMLLRDGCNGMATEAIGGMAVTSEALLGQGQHGWLALFPGLPLVQAAAFRNLRALGGLLVSARRSSGGVVSNVIVTNDAGDGHAKTVALHSPWGGASFVATAQGTGEKPQVTSVPSAIAGVYEFTAKPGVTYHIGALQ